jgi:hypothetical protein
MRKRVPLNVKKPTPLNEVEKQVLAIVLKEFREAVRMRGVLDLTIDPWTNGRGANIFASPNTAGRSYRVPE